MIVAIGTYGDVAPFVAIGAELRRRGVDVALAAAAPFEDVARGAGLDFEAVATEDDYRNALDAAGLWRSVAGVRRMFDAVERTIRPSCEFVLARRRKGATVVVGSSLALGARVAVDLCRAPLVSVHLSPLLMQSRRDPPRLPALGALGRLPPRLGWEIQLGVDRYFVDPMITPRLNAYRAELGLPPVRRLRHWWHSNRRVLLMCPDWFVPPQPDWPPQTLQLDFPQADARSWGDGALDPALAAFLDDGPAPVAVTFGTGMRQGRGLYATAVAACARAGRRRLALSPQDIGIPLGRTGDLFVASHAPLTPVLRRCAAIIHHGGIGTTAAALAAGAPQLIAPLAFDQFDNAARVRALGCGASVGRFFFTSRGVSRRLNALLASPAVASRCAEISDRCGRSDPVSAACDAIEAAFAAAVRAKGSTSPMSLG